MSNLRRQTLIIAVLIVLIGCAGWFAKRFNDTTMNANTLNSKKESMEFFAESRIGRENQRSSIKQDLEKIVNNKESTKDAKTAASAQLMTMLDRGNKENIIETKVKERGFEDVLCFMDDKGVELCVKAKDNLTVEQANQLKEIIVKTSGITPSNIVIKTRQ